MLKQDSQQPALWINPDWDGKGPGTFALIIGASHYAHLDGSKNSYGLGQLHVSALTAYHFFVWLRDHYRHQTPLACCWLLLSPTDDERRVEPTLPEAPEPTFEACRKAVGRWFEKMENLHPTYSQQSRSIFFFSGHGLEITPAKQILLPSDYLEPPVRLVDRALSTDNLYTGLWALNIPEHFLFLDACRNDNEDLRAASPLGTDVLTAKGPRYRPLPGVISPIVYATGPGAAAWEPTDPRNGPSIFGKALLEGLEGRPNMQPISDNNKFWITVRGLEDFLDPRVSDLLIAAGTQVKQPVMIWGPTKNIRICEVPTPQAALTGATPPDVSFLPQSASPVDSAIHFEANVNDGFSSENRQRSTSRDTSFIPSTSSLENQRSTHRAHMDEVPLPRGWRLSMTKGWESAHDIVRSETLTNLLWNTRIYDLQTGQESELKAGGKQFLTIAKITRSTGSYRTYHVDVQLSGHSTYWVELDSDRLKQKIACVLPSDKEELPRYTIEIDVADDMIANFDVVLSPTNTDLLGQAAALWSKFRSVDIEEAATNKEMVLLERAVKEKMRSPLAATVAALLLLRAWRHDLLHDWARNLAEYFPQRPDGCVVWAEQLLRTTESGSPNEVVPWLLRLNDTGIPHTAEGLAHAARQVPELIKFGFPSEQNRNEEQKLQHDGLTKLNSQLTKALRVFRPGGLCTTFIGRKELITPDLLGINGLK